MIKISTIPNIQEYLIDTCDMSSILARKMTSTLNLYCSSANDIDTVFNKLKGTIEDVLTILNNNPKKAIVISKEYGYSDKNELIEVLDTFITTTDADELLIEEEFIDEDEIERKVWSDGEYSIWVNNLTNATHVTLFKDKKRVGSLSTSGTYTNEDGKWLKISLADIEKQFRGMGLGKKLYQTLLQYSPSEYVGIASYLPDRYNMKQVPNIYRRFGGFVKGDFAFIPKQKDIKENILIQILNILQS